MHVLNLDLDFFLNAAVYHRSDDTNARPDDEDLIPFNIISHKSLFNRYRDVHWDFVFLSHSPGHVPTHRLESGADLLCPHPFFATQPFISNMS